MLAQSLNKLTVSCTIQQRNILNFFSVLPRRFEWRQEEEEEEEGAGEDEDCDHPEADTQERRGNPKWLKTPDPTEDMHRIPTMTL
eukprot:1115950-Prorocentrum_minimum.AAC.1